MIGLINFPLARYYKQHKFEEGQDLEEVEMVSSSLTKLLSKTMQGSDDDNEVNESEEFRHENRDPRKVV